MKKLLSLLGSVGMIGTAGATVVACGNKAKKENPKDNPKDIEVAKGTLANDIFEAQGLVNTSKKGESVTNELKNAIKNAQAVFDKPNATVQELKNASDTLKAAIKKFNDVKDPVDTAREALQAKITEAEALATKAEKEKSAVDALNKAIATAKSELENTNEAKVKEATTKLEAAIKTYNDARSAVEAAKADLQKEITTAEGLVTEAKKEASAVAELKKAVDTAKSILNSAKATAKELDDATTNLKAAITKYNQAKDATLVAAQKALQSKIEEAEGLVAEAKKDQTAIDALKAAIDTAKSELENTNEAKVKEATTKLEAAIATYKSAADKKQTIQ